MVLFPCTRQASIAAQCQMCAGVSLKAWHLLSVFTGTIVGIITTPLPLGAVAMLGLGAAMLTKVKWAAHHNYRRSALACAPHGYNQFVQPTLLLAFLLPRL
jgi:di/tricarboxylate transporter